MARIIIPATRPRYAAGTWRAALLAGLLAGCADWGGGTAGAIDSWRGARYAEVEAQWGAPKSSVTTADGQIAYTWMTPATRFGIFAGSGGVGVATTFPLPGMGGDPLRQCERTLTFKDGYVIQQAWLGPNAMCSPYKRR